MCGLLTLKLNSLVYLLDIPIVVYVAHVNGWVMQSGMHDDVTTKSMFLRNYDDHLEVVLSTQYVWEHNLARTAQAQCPDSQ